MPFSNAEMIAVGAMPVPTPTSRLAAMSDRNGWTRNLPISTTINRIEAPKVNKEYVGVMFESAPSQSFLLVICDGLDFSAVAGTNDDSSGGR